MKYGPKTQWKFFTRYFRKNLKILKNLVIWVNQEQEILWVSQYSKVDISANYPKLAFSLVAYDEVVMKAKLCDEEISFIMQPLTPESHNSQRKVNWKKDYTKTRWQDFRPSASHFLNFAIKQCCLLPGKQGDRDSHKYSDYLVSCWFPPLCLLLCGCPPSPSEEVEAAALFLPAVPPGGREDLQMGENCWFWFDL